MEESIDELMHLFPVNLRNEAILYLKNIKSKQRSVEWLSTRIMLFELIGEDKIVLNNDDGRPYLADNSFNISITHTKNYAAILLHRTYQVGIDIEIRSERVKKVADKFISDNEYIDPDQKTVHQLLHWSTKESMFKLMNEQGIDFKDHLYVEPFTPSTQGVIKATESKTLQRQTFNVHYEVHKDYVLTWIADNQS